MTEMNLKAYLRTEPGVAKAGSVMIEAELYGPGVENRHLVVDAGDVEKIIAAGGRAKPVALEINGNGTASVIIREAQRDHLKGRLLHVDFYELKADQKVRVEAALKPIGQSRAVTAYGGTLVKNVQFITIECLPEFLVSELEVDLSKLANLKDTIRIEDLTAPAGVTIKNSPRDPVISVVATRKAKAAAADTAAPAAAAPVAEEKSADKEKKSK